MFSYLVRRLLLLLPTLVGTTAVVFFVSALMPGGVAGSLLTPDAQLRPEERKAIEAYYKARYGIDKPLPVQYLNWLNRVSPIGIKQIGRGFPAMFRFGFKAPDLGESWNRHRPISALITESLPITLLLEMASLPLIYLIAVTTGIAAARARGKI